MKPGLQARLDRLFNRHGDGRAVCVAADHGYMSDVTANVVNLRTITEAVIRGGVDGILVSPGQAVHLAPLFQGRDGPALIVRADWMNMPRLGTSNVANAVPQRDFAQREDSSRRSRPSGSARRPSPFTCSWATATTSKRRVWRNARSLWTSAAGSGCRASSSRWPTAGR